MKRKTTAAVICAVICTASIPAYAEPAISVVDAGKNRIAVTGSAQQQETVTLMILNPGFTEADADSGASGAVNFLRAQKADSSGYSFDVILNMENLPADREFTAVVNINGKKESTVFSFYTYAEKLSIIDKLNSASTCAGILDEAMGVFSLNSSELMKGGNRTEIIKAIDNAKSLLYSNKFPSDPDEVYSALRGAMLCAAYNSSLSGLVISDGTLMYGDTILNMSDTTEYDDYINNLSSAGRAAVNSKLLSGSYKTIEEVKTALCDAVPLNVIVNYRQNGFGHVQTYLDKYRDYYSSHGFNLSKLSSIANKNNFYNTLAASNVSTIEALAELFNKYTETSSTGGSGGSGGGGTGGGVSTGPKVQSSPGTTPNYVQSESTQSTEDGVPFTDINTVPWAEAAITYLYKSGVINGKSYTVFAPSDTVTRAELVKMAVTAFNLESQENGKIFSDVPQDEWYAEYVNTASALGVISGVTEDLFAPIDEVTREQAAKILVNAAKAAGKTLGAAGGEEFADDYAIEEYARESIYILRAEGVVSGRDNNMFEPKSGVTRAEAAKMIYGLIAKEKI